LDFLVLNKNWHDDPTISVKDNGGLKDVDEFDEDKEDILNVMNAEFFYEVENHVEDCVQNRDLYP
jgi:hypothetical protein